MNISWRLLFCTAACVAAVSTGAGCGDPTPGSTASPTTGTSVSTPATSPEPSSPAPTKTVTIDRPVTVTPSPTKRPTTPEVIVPSTKPTAPTGPAPIKVRSYMQDLGNYPEYVRKDPTRIMPANKRLRPGDTRPLICASQESMPIVLKLNGTTPTGHGNSVSTLVTKTGLLVFGQKGSVLPSDTLILDEVLYGNVPTQLLDPDMSDAGFSMLLPSTSVTKGGWGKFTTNTQLVVCRPGKRS